MLVSQKPIRIVSVGPLRRPAPTTPARRSPSVISVLLPQRAARDTIHFAQAAATSPAGWTCSAGGQPAGTGATLPTSLSGKFAPRRIQLRRRPPAPPAEPGPRAAAPRLRAPSARTRASSQRSPTPAAARPRRPPKGVATSLPAPETRRRAPAQVPNRVLLPVRKNDRWPMAEGLEGRSRKTKDACSSRFEVAPAVAAVQEGPGGMQAGMLHRVLPR